MKLFYSFFFLLLIFFGATFAALNAEPVFINYYLGNTELPLSLLLMIILALGGCLGLIASFTLIIRTRLENRKLRQQVKLSEKEIANLRTLPLQDPRL